MSGTWADAGLRVVWTDFPEVTDPAITLQADCSAYWKLDEISGTRLDSTGNYNLSDVNNNTSGTVGKIGNGVYFDATNQALQSADTLFQVSIDNSITFAFWFKVSAYPSLNTHTFIAQHNDVDNLAIDLRNESNVKFIRFNVYGSVDTREDHYLPTLGQWAFFVGWYDGTDHQSHVLINNNASLFKDRSGTLSSPTVGVGDFLIAPLYSDSASQFIVDEFCIFPRVLTSEEISYLYNSGNGRTLYP